MKGDLKFFFKKKTYMQVRCKHIGTSAAKSVVVVVVVVVGDVDDSRYAGGAHCSSRPNSQGSPSLLCSRHPLPSSGQKVPLSHRGGKAIVVVKSFGRSFLLFLILAVGTGIGRLSSFNLTLGSDMDMPALPPPKP